MSRLARHILHVARFVLEARTALSVGSGGADGVYDHPIARDANGLPTIPGTSLAGVLRHLWANDHGTRSGDSLFGYQRRDRGDASRLEVAACALHDSRGQPVEGLLLDSSPRGRLRADWLLSAAAKTREDPSFRDRVRLNHRGAAIKTGKFDRGLLAAGHRFSGELRLWSEIPNDPDWSKLLGLLADPRLRLGGATRAGMGAMALVSLHAGSFDLRNPENSAAFQKLKPGLGDTAGLAALDLAKLPPSGVTARALTIQLVPRDFWRIGQGDESLGRAGKTPDLLPKLEPFVTWEREQARAVAGTRYALVPGSSVKGALAHRAAFHWNALNDRFADDPTVDVTTWDKSEHCPGVKEIFGYAKDRDTASGRSRDATGQAGHLCIDDAHIEIAAQDRERRIQAMIHNSIDRFTGGARNRMLFTEELLYRCPIPLRITLLPGIDKAEATARRALARAIRDLCEGRLALGAGVTKGHGSFTGAPDETARNWLQEQGEDWT